MPVDLPGNALVIPFIGHHVPDRVTDLMNEVIDVIGDHQDAFAAEAALRVLQKVDW